MANERVNVNVNVSQSQRVYVGGRRRSRFPWGPFILVMLCYAFVATFAKWIALVLLLVFLVPGCWFVWTLMSDRRETAKKLAAATPPPAAQEEVGDTESVLRNLDPEVAKNIRDATEEK